MPRKLVDKYLTKLVALKVIKSKKQVLGSYVRGNDHIGDVDIVVNRKDK